MSFFEDLDWSEVDLDDTPWGCGIVGCKDITRPPDLKKIAEREQERKEYQQKLNEAKTKQIQDEEAKKVRKKYIIYGLIAVVGYFAYKKFKK